ncbi:zinc transporter ZntB [Stutzerimonas nosocomialis]|uniref:Zinc transporter ZntB n=1 Tax=Stutzerimonas nosocomialis TaxID=1056496 RepID=A0A5R9QAQ4_9GAMM|nr:CorA family divalent cation transporter [Stutzerimonas nosocomialis]TLX60096.1 zinc transporter ZntB [Stutzerimonas nosocomialis]TLX62171.1 zinc transporter ZntB [Stutzerimonas nosocomialis]
MQQNDNDRWGLIHALVLDGRGGARSLAYASLESLRLEDGETLWVHLDRSHPEAVAWLRSRDEIGTFACDVLLEENTRPRMLALPGEALALFLRGVNLNPGAEPEDMVSLRVFANARMVVSLRLRPLRATELVIEQLAGGQGPNSASRLLLALADSLTDRVDDLVAELGETTDSEEERLEQDSRYTPEHERVLSLRRRAASLRRFLLPQRDLYAQLTRTPLSWRDADDSADWNELSNRLIRFVEELELIRERASLVLESEQRRLNERMNRTMYLIGIITAFFLPLSFFTGLLGINVGGIPGAEFPYGFAVACGLIGAVALFQWWILRRLRWV